ncbi:uncharacterized protein At2g02148 isoform X1 [Capsicum annuum]|uniref:uncharacterized protein At2g02148 isoform X1 n=1 Tax=Capsicum annuum TaxID=4072 RepID=UPI0007BEA8F2|nr:uncharacterized protein At2g02148 isoform X1 [Capsicum annuum]
MGTRVPVQHYDMRSAADSYIETSLHDLNAEGIGGGGGGDDVDRGGGDVTDDSMGSGDESTAVVSDCLQETFRNSLPLHGMVVEDDHTSIENSGSSTGSYNIVTIDDISPIETARTRFLDIIVDHFIRPHVVDVVDSEADFAAQTSQDKMSKRKFREIQYEGDATYVLPLMYVANMYETLVNEVNVRLSSLNGMREKTIGVALEAAGGLYRKLAKKFPRKGPCMFKRRELATSFETRARFPELVIQEEKRVRFVVVNGLAIVEKPTSLCIDDAEWFRRMTGRNEVAISPRDYKFYAPRHKYRRASNSISNITGLSAFTSTENASSLSAGQSYRSVSEESQQTTSKQHMQPLAHQAQFHPLQQSHHINQSQHISHFSHNQQCGPQSHLSEISHTQQSPTIPPHMACLQQLGHVGGRMHIMPASPAKFCDECGTPYLRETSKFCSECGTKRLGI